MSDLVLPVPAEASFDVAIVGAGFAGIAAAYVLGRHRRRTIVFDGGPTRNYRARGIHGYLGFEAGNPVELRARGVAEVRRYGVVFVQGWVEAIKGSGGGFGLVAGSQSWRAQRVLLATGVADGFPDIEGFADYYGASIFHCPACDGWEAQGRDVAVIGWGRHLGGFVRELCDWAKSITIITDGRYPRFPDDEIEHLRGERIQVFTGTVRRFAGAEGELLGLLFEDETFLPAQMVFFSIGLEHRTELAEALGCRLSAEACIEIDEHGRTSVEGVWAAGDVVPQPHQVAIATASGMRAAFSIHESLAIGVKAAQEPSPPRFPVPPRSEAES